SPGHAANSPCQKLVSTVNRPKLDCPSAEPQFIGPTVCTYIGKIGILGSHPGGGGGGGGGKGGGPPPPPTAPISSKGSPPGSCSSPMQMHSPASQGPWTGIKPSGQTHSFM